MEYCTEFEVLLDLYVDGELSAAEMLRVQTHLDTCSACRAYVDDLLAIRAAFPDAEDTVVPEGFAEGVMAAVRASAVPAKKATRPTPWKKILLPLAACCAVVVLAMPFGGMMGGAKQEAAPASEAPAAAPAAALYTADVAEPEADMEEAPVQAAGGIASNSPAEAAALAPTQAQDSAARLEEHTMAADAPAAMQFSPTSLTDGVENEKAIKSASASLTLTAEEAGTLLEEYEIAAETEADRLYLLSAEEFDALLLALENAGVETVVKQADTAGFSVTVLK